MTITELREMLENLERKGKGNCEICVVSANCEPISEYYEKWTTDVGAYFDNVDNTFTISD